MVMYDEPFVGQDPIGLGVLLSLVKRLNQALGLIVGIVSHDLQETLSIADHVIMIANTRVAFEGSPQDMQLSEDPLVQQFLHGRPDGPVHFHFPAFPIEDALPMVDWITGVGGSTLFHLSNLGRATLILIQAIMLDDPTSVCIGV